MCVKANKKSQRLPRRLWRKINLKYSSPLNYTVFTAVVSMACVTTSDCTSKLSNTDCVSSQCACNTGYTGDACSGNLDCPGFNGRSMFAI